MSDDSNKKNKKQKYLKSKITAADDGITKRVETLERKGGGTVEQIILNNFKAFCTGLFLGVLIALYTVWNERQERKELKRELIEYVDKSINRMTINKQ